MSSLRIDPAGTPGDPSRGVLDLSDDDSETTPGGGSGSDSEPEDVPGRDWRFAAYRPGVLHRRVQSRVEVIIEAQESGRRVDPRDTLVDVALVAPGSGDPDPGDAALWKPATWQRAGRFQPEYRVFVLVGAGTSLPLGNASVRELDLWVRVGDIRVITDFVARLEIR